MDSDAFRQDVRRHIVGFRRHRGGAAPNVRLEDDETVLFDVKSTASLRLLLIYGADPGLKDDLFDRTAAEATLDPITKAAYSETSVSE